MRPIIRAEKVGKQYRIGALQARRSLRETLGHAVRTVARSLRPGIRSPEQMLWALRDVSFQVAPGEVLGILGSNGAGKSTLLKILARVTDPTEGEIDLFGRTGSLLEVGTGFHPELTGRENIYLNGIILGMSRREVERKFDDIVAFAEMERFLDTPVKRYSSGMYVRLAFAVASSLEPEILIVDEVLSVGDMAFRKKCLARLQEIRARAHTVLLVTHDMIMARALCTRALALSQGRVVANGAPAAVIPHYEKLVLEQEQGEAASEQDRGMGRVLLHAVDLQDEAGRQRTTFASGASLRAVVEYEAREKVENPIVYVGIRRPDGFICTATSTRLQGQCLPDLEGPGVLEIDLRDLALLPGHYVLDITFYDDKFDYRSYFLGRRKTSFEVVSDDPSLDDRYGVFAQPQNWTIALRELRSQGVCKELSGH